MDSICLVAGLRAGTEGVVKLEGGREGQVIAFRPSARLSGLTATLLGI